jgi:CHAD domain-containing protein
MSLQRHTEQEWQFAAAALQPVRDWLASQPHTTAERRFAPQPTLDLRDTYYDSPDWMIFRAGYALRVRQAQHVDGDRDGAEITLKSLSPPQGGLARRTELTENVGAAGLDEVLTRGDGIGGRIRELLGARSLAPLFHAHTRRERQRLLEADSDLALAEVDLDETSIETPAGAQRELRRVEVECLHADPGALEPMVDALRAAADLQPVEVSKFRAGLEAAGLDPLADQYLGSTDISATMPFAEAQLALLRRYFAAVASHEAGVRAGSAAAVHEMRVAARHLDVLLRVFRGFGPTWAVRSRGRLRGLIKALGAVRDCDVQLDFVDRQVAGLGAVERADLAPLRERLETRRRRARERLLRALDSPPVRAWIREWRTHLQSNTPGTVRARRAITAVVARRLVREQARALRKRVRKLEGDAAGYHDVRIAAKRLRYTVEAFAGLYGEPATAFIDALARLQTVLGEYNDAQVRERCFMELVSRGPRLPASTSFLAGRWVERDSQAFTRFQRRFERAYRRVRRRRWRELSAAMKRATEISA